jgi:FAD:protein FMN transferase
MTLTGTLSSQSNGATEVVERRFRAMGSDAHLIIVGDEAAGHANIAMRRIAQLEQRWSRFIDSSEICELNRRAGHDVTVSADTVLLVERAVEAWRLTGGGFDPTLLGAVLRAGYDVSFAEMPADTPATLNTLLAGCTDIAIVGNIVRLPAGTGFDPGGIGKGLAADIVLDELLDAGVCGACVNLGGDLRVGGASPHGDAWTIAVEHPLLSEPVAHVGMHAGAVATSTTLRRRWTVDGQQRHHLIDPDTGTPTDSDIDVVTVIAAAAWTAEVLAKAVLLRGSQRAFDIIDDVCAHALVIDSAGAVRATPGFQSFAGVTPLTAMVAESGRQRSLV